MENRSKGDLGIPASHSPRLTNHLDPRWLLGPSGTTFRRHGIVICVISFSASLSLKTKWFTESLGEESASSHGRVGWRHSRSGPLMFGSCPCPYFHGGLGGGLIMSRSGTASAICFKVSQRQPKWVSGAGGVASMQQLYNRQGRFSWGKNDTVKEQGRIAGRFCPIFINRTVRVTFPVSREFS